MISRHDWVFENNAGKSDTKINEMGFVCLPPLPASPHLPNLYAAKCLAHVPVCGEIKKSKKKKEKKNMFVHGILAQMPVCAGGRDNGGGFKTCNPNPVPTHIDTPTHTHTLLTRSPAGQPSRTHVRTFIPNV